MSSRYGAFVSKPLADQGVILPPYCSAILETSNSLADKLAADPASLTARALAVPRCQCAHPLVDVEAGECVTCGREIRPVGTLGREWRKAAYDRELRRARGQGLDPLHGFKGVAIELGPNPAVELLHDALEARLAALSFAEDLAAWLRRGR